MKNPRIRFTNKVKLAVKEYNEELPEIPDGVKELQDRMLLGSGWEKSSGPCEGVFNARGCVWSVKWRASGGRLITPVDYWPLEYMPVEALIFEMLDHITRETLPGGDKGRNRNYLDFLIELRALESGFFRVDQFMKWLPKLPRGATPEYICAFDPPGPNDGPKIIIPRFRPGWPERCDVLKPMMKASHTPKGMRVAR